MIKFNIRPLNMATGTYPVFTRIDAAGGGRKYTTFMDVDDYVAEVLGPGMYGSLSLSADKFAGATLATSIPKEYEDERCTEYRLKGGREVTCCDEALWEFFGTVPSKFYFKLTKEEA